MKNFKLLILLFLIYACSSGTNNRNETVISSAEKNKNVTTIDIDNAKKVDRLLFSSIFKEPKIIILETNEECLIKNVRTIEVFNKNIYILDDEEEHLFVFDMNGKFLQRIASVGDGPGEYIQISDFSIDRKGNTIYLLDEASNKIHKYDTQSGNFLGSIQTVRKGKRTFCAQYLDGKIYMNETEMHKDSEKYLLKEIDAATGKQEKSYLDADSYNKGWNLTLRLPHSFFYSRNTSAPKYVEMFMDTIVSISNGKITPAYAVRSKDFVTHEDMKKIIDSNYGNDGVCNLKTLYEDNKIFKINSFIEFRNFISFQYMKGNDRHYLLYNNETKETQISELFINDYIYDNNYIPMDLCFNNDKGVYSLLRLEFIPYFIDNITNAGNLKTTIDKYERLLKVNEDTNPILFYHEYK